MSFWNGPLPWAEESHKATGVLTSVILAQWISENGRKWPPPYNNPGNVNDTQHGGQQGFPTLQAGVNAYISTMLLGYYVGVRHAVGYVAQADALGRSPWAAGRYIGSAPFNYPGGLLIALIQENNLTQYDGTAPPVPVPPPPHHPPIPEEDMEPFIATDGTQQWIIWPNATKSVVGTPADGTALTTVLGWKYLTLSDTLLNAIPTAS